MKKRKFYDGGIYTAEMGQPPMEPDGGSISPKRGMKKPPMPVKKPPTATKKPVMPVTPKPRGAAPDESVMPAPAFKKGGSVGSASKRADGIATKGKTKGTFV
jgi:hypothetical protein